jgi:hypothetical protein
MNDTRWDDARRIESWAGEVRVNLIRLAAIVAFYGHHLVNVYLFRDDPYIAGPFHASVTALVLAWSALVLVLYIGLSRRWLPDWLPHAVVAWDLLMVTALLVLAASPTEPGNIQSANPRTWLTVLYFLVIASAALRLSLPLIYTATLGSMACYLFFLGVVAYGLKVPDGHRLGRTNQVIFVLGLGAAGILAGQMVRQARRLVQGYPVVVEDAEPAAAGAGKE